MKLGLISSASVLFLGLALPALAAPAPVSAPLRYQASRIILAQAATPAAGEGSKEGAPQQAAGEGSRDGAPQQAAGEGSRDGAPQQASGTAGVVQH